MLEHKPSTPVTTLLERKKDAGEVERLDPIRSAGEASRQGAGAGNVKPRSDARFGNQGHTSELRGGRLHHGCRGTQAASFAGADKHVNRTPEIVSPAEAQHVYGAEDIATG